MKKKSRKLLSILSGMPMQQKKADNEHFMLKEMYEQPKAILDTFSPRIKGNDIVIEELGMSDEEIKAIRKS